MPLLACAQYAQPYSVGGSSDAASVYQSTVATFYCYYCEIGDYFTDVVDVGKSDLLGGEVY